jgi:hypothetical protein
MAATPHFRLFARRLTHLPALLASEGQGVRDALLINVGLGGACVRTTAGLGNGAKVTLEVNTPNLWDPLILDGIVVWSAPADAEGLALAGIRFGPISSSGLRALVELLGKDRYD